MQEIKERNLRQRLQRYPLRKLCWHHKWLHNKQNQQRHQMNTVGKFDLQLNNQNEINPKYHIKGKFLSIKCLLEDNSIKILPADKRNVTVIIDVEVYRIKVQNVLKERRYKEQKKYSATILIPHYSKSPHLYGLLKIH